MELWIRSQDKERLLKPISLTLNNDKTSIYGYYDKDYLEVLGKYATRERALEVLDEIQKCMTPKYKKGEYEEIDLILKSYMIPRIYEMPKE